MPCRKDPETFYAIPPSCRGVEWSHLIKKRSQNLVFARTSRKNYMGARLLVLAKFLQLLVCSQSRFNVLDCSKFR